jgi:hypothetical protein
MRPTVLTATVIASLAAATSSRADWAPLPICKDMQENSSCGSGQGTCRSACPDAGAPDPSCLKCFAPDGGIILETPSTPPEEDSSCAVTSPARRTLRSAGPWLLVTGWWMAWLVVRRGRRESHGPRKGRS